MAFRYKSFPVYQKILVFIREIYTLSNSLPRQEKFELASQLRRAATSVLLNLAEGSARGSDADFNRFLTMAIGSITEAAAILDILFHLKLITLEQYNYHGGSCEELAKQLCGFSRKLKKI